MELAAAYSYCHSPEAMVTHLDAHSRNILYVNDGGRIRLWLTDFGLSKGYTDPHDQRFINDVNLFLRNTFFTLLKCPAVLFLIFLDKSWFFAPTQATLLLKNGS